MDFEYVIQTDIVDCYAAIYTHSIAWSLHTKETAKSKREKSGAETLIGNIIDNHIQDMHQGQTNGIPQGSVLMDFLGEMILGYADLELTSKIGDFNITDYQILRYRDDYRIFVNNPQEGELILKCLTEVMIDLGLKLNPAKTSASSDVIPSSIKSSKLDWMYRKQGDNDLQKHLLIIHDHSMAHPNSGSLIVSLKNYYNRLSKIKNCPFSLQLIAIVVDIACRNPRTYVISAAILSKLISFLPSTHEKRNMIKRIRAKFAKIPNTGHSQIWLQRISLSYAPDVEFEENLCRLVSGEDHSVWNNDWISYKSLNNILTTKKIINSENLIDIASIVPIKEVELFDSTY